MTSRLNELIIKYINTLTILPSACQDLIDDPDGKSDYIGELIDECDEDLSRIKTDILEIIRDIQNKIEIEAEVTDNGLKIGENSNGNEQGN